MAEYVIICSACGAENKDWEYECDTYFFTCTDCGYDNEKARVWK